MKRSGKGAKKSRKERLDKAIANTLSIYTTKGKVRFVKEAFNRSDFAIESIADKSGLSKKEVKKLLIREQW